MRISALLCLAACTHAPTQTGLEIKTTYSVALDQLLIAGTVDGTAAFAPGVLPDQPRPLQPEGESATVYLPAAVIGKTLTLRVDGLRSGAVVATGGATLTVIGRRIDVVVIALTAPVVCGDGAVNPLLELCDDGNRQGGDGCSAECVVEAGYSCSGAPSQCLPRCGGGPACAQGQHCVSEVCVCDANTCPSGCCAGNLCMAGNAASACGSAGNACTTCPAGEACGAGTCSGCAQSCTGCCEGSTCISVASSSACGAAGARCLACDTVTTDRCTSGACTCGAQLACKSGEICKAGKCSCDATCDGCCDAGGCEIRGTTTCGSSGATCLACDPMRSDACAATGTCACGGAPACAIGESCTGGACLCGGTVCAIGLHCGAGASCVCDVSSCSGCCADTVTCLSYAQESAASCGSGGAQCTQCGHGTKRCVQGACVK